MERNGQLHKGHRARMRQRVSEAGAASLAPHELLEMLLYYVLPQRDTNEIAHTLIEHFGSLEGVLEATPEALSHVQGIKEYGACFFALLLETAKRYAAAHLADAERPALETPDKIAGFLYPFFIGAVTEQSFALLLDNAMRPLDCMALGEGSVSEVLISVRRIAERAYTKKASALVLAHNHPQGIITPSNEDVRLTKRLAAAFDLLDLPLIEHFIFAGQRYAPVMAHLEAKEMVAYGSSSLLAVLRRMQSEKEKNRSDAPTS